MFTVCGSTGAFIIPSDVFRFTRNQLRPGSQQSHAAIWLFCSCFACLQTVSDHVVHVWRPATDHSEASLFSPYDWLLRQGCVCVCVLLLLIVHWSDFETCLRYDQYYLHFRWLIIICWMERWWRCGQSGRKSLWSLIFIRDVFFFFCLWLAFTLSV